jgi:hypothetical protein
MTDPEHGPPKKVEGGPDQSQPSTNSFRSHDATSTAANSTANIAPDIDCPHCGMVIVCPHMSSYRHAATITVHGPGRCTECSFHVDTQGHREGCSGTAPVEPPPDSRTFLERVRARQKREADEIHRWLDGTPGEPYGSPPAPRPLTGAAQPGRNPAYVKAAIEADIQRLADATEGTRNSTLHAVACNVFEFVKGGHANEAVARAQMERIAAAIGLMDSEIQSTLRSAWNKVGARDVPAPTGVAPAYTLSPAS